MMIAIIYNEYSHFVVWAFKYCLWQWGPWSKKCREPSCRAPWISS